MKKILKTKRWKCPLGHSNEMTFTKCYECGMNAQGKVRCKKCKGPPQWHDKKFSCCAFCLERLRRKDEWAKTWKHDGNIQKPPS